MKPLYNFPEVFDVTLPFSGNILRYPGDSIPILKKESDIENGDALTASHLSMNCHVGTHVDAPAHFLGDGETLDELRLGRFHGPAIVYEILDCDVITRQDLRELKTSDRHHVFFKTKNSELLQLKEFATSYCTISTDVAEWLCTLQPLSVGFDYYSLDPYEGGNGFPAHTVFARAGIPVYVCLNLKDVPPGDYEFSGFPLRLLEAEASPVRAVLLKK